MKEEGPTFTFLFYTEVTHSDFNQAQLLDTHLASFIESMDMSSTLFALMPRYLPRYGPHLQTEVGRIESRMPLFTLLVPDYIMKEYPSLGVNLMINEERLTTWLDVHQMLTDIPYSNYSQIRDADNINIKRAYSLWREQVPKERTCVSALIPDNFCVCHQSQEIDASQDMVLEASQTLLNLLNIKIAPYSHLCTDYSLIMTKLAAY